MGLIASAYAYGQVDQINSFIEKFLGRINNKPYEFIINFRKRKDKKYLGNLFYRFNTDSDFILLIIKLRNVILKYDSLKNAFMMNYDVSDENIIPALTKFIYLFNFEKMEQRYSLLPNPENKSACKRLNLFLRWMIRKDEIDVGIWQKVKTSKLVMPVDTHIARIAKGLNLVKRKSVDLKFALELTEKLKQFDANDPVKYDFALCHLGIDKKKFL